MIILTGKETSLPAYIMKDEITSMETHGGSSPFTRIWLKNEKEHHEYFLDVRESKEEISEIRKKINDISSDGKSNVSTKTRS